MAAYSKRWALAWLAPLVLMMLCLPSPVTAAAPAVPPTPKQPLPDQDQPDSPPVTYTVRPGDNLSLIARQFHTRVAALQQANKMGDSDLILIGQHLAIPILPIPPQLASLPDPRRGLAMAVSRLQDVSNLGVAWYYTWQWCSEPGCLPMLYRMEDPPGCAPTILVGNEPNAIRPYGFPVTTTLAAERVRAIELICPHSQLVVGNVSADDWSSLGGTGSGRDWLAGFLAAYRQIARRDFHQAFGVHCYAVAVPGYCLDRLARLRALYSGPMWVTEFGVLSGGPDPFDILLNYIAAHFDRFAPYTNRQPHTGQGWELTSGVELVQPNGHLTPLGEAYANWPLAAGSQMR